MQAVFVDVAFLKQILVLGFPLSLSCLSIRNSDRRTPNSNILNVRIFSYSTSRYRAVKTLLYVPTSHVRMAERSKAPDSRVELFLTGVFWSTNVGVGSNPTSDKSFSVIEIRMRNRAS